MLDGLGLFELSGKFEPLGSFELELPRALLGPALPPPETIFFLGEL
jgi:hypothetical protein